MHIVYWAHSYRADDADVNRHFGLLIEQAERMVVNFDPPSKSVNSSKLEQNLRSCDGMVAVLTWRSAGPSPYILYEIGLCLRARKPVIVFLDDRLSGDVLASRVLQQRFSHRTYFRQVREQVHALRALKAFMGDPPPTRYQSNLGQRACGVVGLRGLARPAREAAAATVASRGYRLIDLESLDIANPLVFDQFESLASLDVALRCVDSGGRRSSYWTGALGAAALPTIAFTADTRYRFDPSFPRDFQPRSTDGSNVETLAADLSDEFALFEQDFLKTESPEVIERYVTMQLNAASLSGRYEPSTRNQFIEVIMGDQYRVSGSIGVGRNVHVHDVVFHQAWSKIQGQVDLDKLADELGRLKQAMTASAKEPEHQVAVGAVAAAEQSARRKDGPKVLEYLRKAGNWAFDVAREIGVGLAVELLKQGS